MTTIGIDQPRSGSLSVRLDEAHTKYYELNWVTNVRKVFLPHQVVRVFRNQLVMLYAENCFRTVVRIVKTKPSILVDP